MAEQSKSRAEERADNIVVGLDIGTHKVAAVVGEINPDGSVKVLALGSSMSRGMRKGAVTEIDAVAQSIREAVQQAELQANHKITSVYVGISGAHIRSCNSEGVVAVSPGGIVTAGDIERATETARVQLRLESDREIIHVLPQEYVVDDQEGVREPLDMAGERLKVKLHIVTGLRAAVRNIELCVRRCGLEIREMVLQQLASSLAVLSDDEREQGVTLVDIGGGTTDLAVFHGGSIRYTAVIPIGGTHITNDISIGLHTPAKAAESIKKEHGFAAVDKDSLNILDEKIEVPNFADDGTRYLPKRHLADIIGPRTRELFEMVEHTIDAPGLRELLTSGLVLTGGTSLLRNIVPAVQEHTVLQVRLGKPRNLVGISENVYSPQYATGVGLVLYGAQQIQQERKTRRSHDYFTKGSTINRSMNKGESARNPIRDTARDSVRDAVREGIRDVERETGRDASRDVARDSARDMGRDVSRDAPAKATDKAAEKTTVGTGKNAGQPSSAATATGMGSPTGGRAAGAVGTSTGGADKTEKGTNAGQPVGVTADGGHTKGPNQEIDVEGELDGNPQSVVGSQLSQYNSVIEKESLWKRLWRGIMGENN